MARLRYLTHPQVCITPEIPVPDWGLSDVGKSRAVAFSGRDILRNTTLIISSAETKAQETAAIIAAKLGVVVETHARTHENDRSATGFLRENEFETVADAFFANPNKSIRGWERAIDAQTRIVGEVEKILTAHISGDVLMVGHGAVGTLLYSHFTGGDISRQYDQPAGGGNIFALDLTTRQILHHWCAMETAP